VRVSASSRLSPSCDFTREITGGNSQLGLNGVYHSVSNEYLQDHIDEYVFFHDYCLDSRALGS
jgi:hypothetical protein